MAQLVLSGKPNELVQSVAKSALLERLGTPGDIANVAEFLAGPEAAWINTQTVRFNGGIV